MKQLLRLNQIRSTNRTSLVAWTLHEDTTTWLRSLLSATTPPAMAVVSSWLLSGLGLETLRQQVQGTWSEARERACLPRLRRFLCSLATASRASGNSRPHLAGTTSPRTP
jgi:hypothetical protein